jgi:predicted nucleotidyltransferase
MGVALRDFARSCHCRAISSCGFTACSRRRATLSSVHAPRPLLPFDAAFAEDGLALVVRFGSRESGQARTGSDLDVAVLHVDGRRLAHRELGEWRLRLSERYGHEADVLDLATAGALIRYEVISHGRVLHARDRAAWVNLVARTLIDLDDLGPWLARCREGVRRAAVGVPR